MADFEVTIVGGGAVGLAIAARLSVRHPSLLVLEKNDKYGMETSSRNSEVIHAGIYYKPDSLKARLCVEGRHLLYALCAAHRIAHSNITKLIIASDPSEIGQLEGIRATAAANGVELQPMTRGQALDLEPNINVQAALFSPATGIISAHELMDYFFHETLRNGGTIQPRTRVVGIEQAADGFAVTVDDQGQQATFISEVVINSAGLYSDKVAAMAGIDIDAAEYRLVYAKGDYFAVPPSRSSLVKRLVYPVPHQEGLGVHVVLDLGGRLKFGPDVEYLPDDNFIYNVSDTKRAAFAESVRRILPQITDDEVIPDMAGIRPKLQREGGPAKDFVICHETERGLRGFVNLIGIESPGLTASPAIARYVEDLLFR